MTLKCPTFFPAPYFKNLQQDAHTADDLKVECCDHLATAKSAAECRVLFEEWRQAAVLAGKVSPPPIADFKPDERLGNIRYRDNYLDNLAKILRKDPDLSGVDASDLVELINWVFGEPSRLDDTVARALFDTILKGRRTDQWTVWFFRTDAADGDPFATETDCLPWRLGLRFVKSGSRYVGIDVGADKIVDPRLPTFLHVDWNNQEYWRPNGKTQPLATTPGSCSAGGLSELIAEPPVFDAVKLPFARLSAR
jgi:hypothetical protein